MLRQPTPTRPRRRRNLARLVLGCTVAAALVGCGSGRGARPAPDTPTVFVPAPTPVASATAGSVRDQAIEAYRGMWAAYVRAGLTANPDDPRLRVHATDEALRTLRRGLESMRDRGLYIAGEIVLAPRVTAVEPADRPALVEITDCADDSGSRLYRRSGELSDDEKGGRRLVVATVKDMGGGVWKVVSFGVHKVGTC